MDSRNVKYLLLGKELALTANALTVKTVADLADGKMAVVDAFGTTYLTGTQTPSTELRLVINYAGALMYSPFFKGKNVTAATIRKYHVQEDQVDFIGYDYSSGAISVIADNAYNVRIGTIETDQIGQALNIMLYGSYTSLSTDTQSNITYSLVKNLQSNVNKVASPVIYADRVYSGVITYKEFAGTYGFATVTKGSKWITLSDAPSVAVAVGDILNLAGLAFIVKTLDTTSPTTVFELDLPWQHTSGYVVLEDLTTTTTATVAAGATAMTLSLQVNVGSVLAVAGTVVYFNIANNFYSGKMLNTTTGVTLDLPYKGTGGAGLVLGGGLAAAGGDWGIRLEGIKRTYTSPRINKYSKLRFFTSVENFGLTTITKWNTTKEGSGNWEQLAELEWFCQGFESQVYYGDHLAILRQEVLTTGKYDVLTIDFNNPVGPFPLGDTVALPIQIVAAVDNASGSNYIGTHNGTTGLEEALTDAGITIAWIA